MMEEGPDLQELFFTNLQLLGFNVERMEAQVKIPFNKNMFDLPNRRGAEEVLYFLFSRLNPVMCKEEFRNCWPIADKQQEQVFRRGCNNWLSNINKEEPDAMLPRISPSLFLTPGGAKFYQLLYRFSRYVILQVNDKDNGMKDKEKHKYPMLTQENKELADSIADTVIGCVIRGRNSFLKTAQEIVSLNRQWKDQSTEMVREYRKLNKEIRDTDLKIRDQIQKSSERSAARGSPIARKRRSKSFEPDFDPKSTQRSQKVNEVRGLWKQFDGFMVSEASEREVIESIVDRSLTKYRIDSAHVSIKVPDLLLRECEKEIRRRHVDNTFHHGKLNLISLLQLWNLCLRLLHTRFQDTGVPDFTEDIERISTLAHKNHGLLVASQSLQKEIEELLPELKRSVDQLRTEVEQDMTNTPTLLRTTAVGLGLMEPTPDVSFSPAPSTHERRTTDPFVTLTPQEYATPEAVARISEDISMRVNRVKLFNNSPRISQLENPAVSTNLPRKLAMNQKSNSKGHVVRTKPRVVDVRGQLQSTPTKSMREQPVTGHTGLKALNLQLDVSFDDNNDGISKDQSTLVQRDRSAGGLNVSISKNLSATSTPRARDNPCNVSQEVPRYCDRTPSYSHVSDLNQGDVKHGKSPSDILVDEMFGETPKQSPTRVPKSPDCLVEEVLSKSPDCLVEEVLSSGVLNSPFVTNIDMSHLTEDEINSDPGDKKSKLPVKTLLEGLEKRMSKLYASGDFSRGDMSVTPVQRPHSPVAEFLDHLEFEPREKSLVIMEKQVDALSDLESSSSSQGLEALDKENVLPVLHSVDLLSDHQRSRSQVSANQNVELHVEGDYDLRPEDSGVPVIKDSMHVQESPLLLDIRKIYREAVAEEEGCSRGTRGEHSHTDILDELTSIADTHGNLDSVAMPVFSLNDSDIMDQKEKSTDSVHSPVNPRVRPPVSPGSDNVQELVQNLSQLGADLNGNPVYHNQTKGVDRRIVNQQMSRDWEELELSMEVLDDLMGKSPDQQKSPFLLSPEYNFFGDHQKSSLLNSPLCPQPTDNSSSQGLDLSDDLEESFVPFKEGFSLEGGTTPAKRVTSDLDKDNGSGQNNTDDLLARFQKLKQKTSQIQNSHQHGPESCT